MNFLKINKVHAIGAAKVIAINLLVFLVLIFFIEILARGFIVIKSCIRSDCNFSPITKLQMRDSKQFRSEYIGLSKLDENLGYAPNPGFKDMINAPGWNQNLVSINEYGFRSNDNVTKMYENQQGRILAVGDSFTFGDQVSNDATWPSCLEKSLEIQVDNAGVFGYGTAQSLKRAEIELRKRAYSTIILSTWVGDDFGRDRLSYRTGFPKPAVIKTSNEIEFSEVPDPYRPGTKYNPINKRWFRKFFFEYSIFWNFLIESTRGFLVDFSDDGLNMQHPNAAFTNEIIDWTIGRFSHLNTKEKILLLQYPANNQEKKVLEEREQILIAASKYKVSVIDTFFALQNVNQDQIWIDGKGHHSKEGNAIVCEQILKKLKH